MTAGPRSPPASGRPERRRVDARGSGDHCHFVEKPASGSVGALVQELRLDIGFGEPGPELGDYLGLPINDAARLKADSWDASLLTLPEHQCKPHPADYSPRGPANLRIWRDIDHDSQSLVAIHTHISWQQPERTICLTAEYSDAAIVDAQIREDLAYARELLKG